jgi:hypothetical protein
MLSAWRSAHPGWAALPAVAGAGSSNDGDPQSHSGQRTAECPKPVLPLIAQPVEILVNFQFALLILEQVHLPFHL